MTHVAIGALVFGDHLGDASRCLCSIARALSEAKSKTSDYSFSLCVGANAPTARLREFIFQELPKIVPNDISLELCIPDNNRNVWKYPLMRRMFGSRAFCQSDILMWFDDDSYITQHDAGSWLTDICSFAITNKALIGSIYKINVSKPTIDWLQAQEWAKKPVVNPIKFCTGGWWIAPTEFLVKINYPFPELAHNGGDFSLGEACRQSGVALLHKNSGVAINAGSSGKESGAKRKAADGVSWLTTNQRLTPWPKLNEPWQKNHDFACHLFLFCRENTEWKQKIVPFACRIDELLQTQFKST